MCAYGSFLFGWHVHEKAILLVLVPFWYLIFAIVMSSLLIVEHHEFAGLYFLLHTAGQFALFPLLFRDEELGIKSCLLIASIVIFQYNFTYGITQSLIVREIVLTRTQRLYIFGIVGIQVFYAVLTLVVGSGSAMLPALFDDDHIKMWGKYTFAGNMITSVYCALGVFWVWLKLL